MQTFQAHSFKLLFVGLALVSPVFSTVSEEINSENVEDSIIVSPPKLDSDCDCNDKEALYHKTLRNILNEQGEEKLQSFLNSIRPRKICGSDGEWYTIPCHLKCTRLNNPETKANLHHKKRSFCRGPHKSKHLEKSAALKKANDEKPQKVRQGICICPRHYAPVCASNGVTYGNKCAFECAKHYVEKDITIISNHKCHEEDQTFL